MMNQYYLKTPMLTRATRRTKLTSTCLKHHQQGVAMLLVLIALAIASVLSMTFLSSQATSTFIAENVNNQSHARAIAESGMVMTIKQIQDNPSWRTDFTDGVWVTNQALDGGSFTVVGNDGILTTNGVVVGDANLANNPTDPIVLKITGRYNGVTHVVQAEIKPTTNLTRQLLFVVPNITNLSTADYYKKTQFKTWGYVVSLINAAATIQQLIDASAKVDVIYISGNVAASVIGHKLDTLAVGVLNELPSLYDNFGASSNEGQAASNTSIEISDTKHFITALFPLGTLTLFKQAQTIYNQSNSYASGARVLGTQTSSNKPTLLIQEVGSALVATNSYAPAKRVHLPWGGDAADFNQLTNDALTLWQRALQWAATKQANQVTSANVGASVKNKITVYASAKVDSYDSTQGPYGGENVTSQAMFATNSTNANKINIQNQAIVKGSLFSGLASDPTQVIQVNAGAIVTGTRAAVTTTIALPTVAVPTPTYTGNDADDAVFDHGSNTLTGMLYYEKLELKNNAVVLISGTTTIVCTETFSMSGTSQIRLLPGATLSLYVQDNATILNQARFNTNTSMPSLVAFYLAKNDLLNLQNQATLYARVIAPTGQMTIGEQAQFYGTYLGDVLDIRGQFHHDTATNAFVDSVPVTNGQLPEPEQVVLYEFNPTPLPTPQLVGQWQLDETANATDANAVAPYGIAAGVRVKMHALSEIDSYNASIGSYGASNVTANALVAVNAIASNQVDLNTNAIIKGNVYTGVASLPNTVISLQGGSLITGQTAALATTLNLPTNLTLPANLPTNQGNKLLNSGIWQSDQHFEKLTIRNNAQITVNGNIVVVAEEFKMDAASRITISQGSSLALYVKGKITLGNNAQLNNNSAATQRLTIYQVLNDDNNEAGESDSDNDNDGHGEAGESDSDNDNDGHGEAGESDLDNDSDGHGEAGESSTGIDGDSDGDEGHSSVANMVLKGGAKIAGAIYSQGNVSINNQSEVFGLIQTTKEITLDNSSKIHQDESLLKNNTVPSVDNIANNTGLFYNNVTLAQSGAIASSATAAKFNGINNYLLIPHSDAYLLANGAVSFWFKPDQIGGKQGLFSKDSQGLDSGGQVNIYLNQSHITATLESATGIQQLTANGISIAKDNWYHVTFSWGRNGMQLYINQTLQAENTSYTNGTDATSGGIGNHEPIVVGANTQNSGDLTHQTLTDFFAGSIDDIRIYNQPLNINQVADVYAGSSPQADTSKSMIVKDTSGFGTPLDLTLKDVNQIQWVAGGGLVVTGPTLAISDRAATKIYNALSATDQMTIELLFMPANVSQNGPARIISYSQGTDMRNFTFGQSNGALDWRMRTTSTTSNATPAIQQGNTLGANTLVHVIVSYDGQMVNVYINNTLVSSTPQTGTFNWNNTMKIMLFNESSEGLPWLGTLKRLAIYNRAFNSSQASNVFASLPPGPPNVAANNDQYYAVHWYEKP